MWQTELVALLRVIIGDLDATAYTYSDERLEEVLLLSAQLVIYEMGFGAAYAVNLDAGTLTPDPANVAARNESLLNLIVLKAACFIDTAETKSASNQNIDIQDGSSRIALGGRADARLKLWAKGPCSAYTAAVDEYRAGNRANAGAVVLGPYRAYSSNILYYDRYR